MSKTSRALCLVLALIVGVCSLACGDQMTSSSSSFTCCINGAFYECDDSDAVLSCGEGDTSSCDRDSFRDDECS